MIKLIFVVPSHVDLHLLDCFFNYYDAFECISEKVCIDNSGHEKYIRNRLDDTDVYIQWTNRYTEYEKSILINEIVNNSGEQWCMTVDYDEFVRVTDDTLCMVANDKNSRYYIAMVMDRITSDGTIPNKCIGDVHKQFPKRTFLKPRCDMKNLRVVFVRSGAWVGKGVHWVEHPIFSNKNYCGEIRFFINHFWLHGDIVERTKRYIAKEHCNNDIDEKKSWFKFYLMAFKNVLNIDEIDVW